MFITANVISIAAGPVAKKAMRVTELFRTTKEVQTIRKQFYDTVKHNKDSATKLGVENYGILLHATSDRLIAEVKRALILGMQYEIIVVLTDGAHHHELSINLAHVMERVQTTIEEALHGHPDFATDEYDERVGKEVSVVAHERGLKNLPDARCVVIDINAA